MKPAELDPKTLRAQAEKHHYVPLKLAAEGVRLLADALEIADSTARADIECHLLYEREDGGPWYDLTTIADEDEEMIFQAARYLELREKLTRHPEKPHWVRPWGKEGP